VLAGAPQLDKVLLLGGVEFRLLAAQSALGLGDLHAFPRPHPDQVGLEFSDHHQDVEQQPPDGVVRIMDRAADVELHVRLGEFGDDVAGVGQRAG